jgi:hypothetical protein
MKKGKLNLRNAVMAVVCIAIIVGFISCKEAVTSVELNRNTLTLLEGETEMLIETVLPEKANDKTVRWTSSNPAVAAVNNGLVSAKATGETVISVVTNDGNKTATCTVTVTSPSKKKLLTQKDWKLSQAVSSPAYTNSNGITSADLFVSWFYPCELNDVLSFKPNNATILSQGCSQGEEVFGTWSFLENETKLRFRLYCLEDVEHDDPFYDAVDIITLTQDVFTYSFSWIEAEHNITYTFTLTYRH